MSYFKHHVFFCCNQRAEGEGCCNNLGATAADWTLPPGWRVIERVGSDAGRGLAPLAGLIAERA